jgi:hypothetical protein
VAPPRYPAEEQGRPTEHGLGQFCGSCGPRAPTPSEYGLPVSRFAELPRVRRARPDDAARCCAIYAPYVEATVTSFEEEPPSVREIEHRIASSLRTHDWLVLEGPDGVVG